MGFRQLSYILAAAVLFIPSLAWVLPAHRFSSPTCREQYLSLRPNIIHEAIRYPRRKDTSRNCPPNTVMALFGFGGIELSNVLYDSTSTAFDAWEWTNAIAAPAALVAGKCSVQTNSQETHNSFRRCAGNIVGNKGGDDPAEG